MILILILMLQRWQAAETQRNSCSRQPISSGAVRLKYGDKLVEPGTRSAECLTSFLNTERDGDYSHSSSDWEDTSGFMFLSHCCVSNRRIKHGAWSSCKYLTATLGLIQINESEQELRQTLMLVYSSEDCLLVTVSYDLIYFGVCLLKTWRCALWSFCSLWNVMLVP